MLTWLLFQLTKRKIKNYLRYIGFKDGKVLDVGCGYGWYSRLPAKNYIGIDNDSEILETAKKKHPGVQFQQMDAVKLEFPDATFDLILCNFILHHLTDEQLTRVFKEMVRVVRSGGHILINDLILPRHFKFLAWPVFRLDTGALPRTFEKLQELFSRAGFSPRFSFYKCFLILGKATFEFEAEGKKIPWDEKEAVQKIIKAL